MEKYSQISITLGTLGIVIILVGLFPGIIGLETVEGVGVLQVLVILLGFSVLFTGAYLFAKQVFYPGMPNTLAQDIGTRLTMTGLLIAAAAGLADVLGFGSHGPTEGTRPLLGRIQAIVFVGGILLASSGVIIFAVFGPSQQKKTDSDDEDGTPTQTG
jgi:disulfide bond formation protein DsbB